MTKLSRLFHRIAAAYYSVLKDSLVVDTVQGELLHGEYVMKYVYHKERSGLRFTG